VLEVTVQVQSSAVVPKKKRLASQNYAQAQPTKILYSLCLRSDGSGAKQCSGFDGKISKSGLCRGTTEEVLYSLCLEVKAQVQSSAVVLEKYKQVRTMHRHSRRSTVFIVF